MNSQDQELRKSRNKDLIALICITIISALIFFMINKNIKDTNLITSLSYVSIVAGVLVLVVSYLESSNVDPFVTGKTQTMGVVNSIVGSGVVIIIGAFKFGIIPMIIVVDILMIISRELGRQSRKKYIEKYLDKTGKIIGIEKNKKYNVLINNEEKKMYSNKNLPLGDDVRIVDIKGRYLYVDSI